MEQPPIPTPDQAAPTPEQLPEVTLDARYFGHDPQKILLQTNPTVETETDPWADAEEIDGEIVQETKPKQPGKPQEQPISNPLFYMPEAKANDVPSPKNPAVPSAPKVAPAVPENAAEKLTAKPTEVKFASYKNKGMVTVALEIGESEKGKQIDWDTIPGAHMSNSETLITTASGKRIRVMGPYWDADSKTVAQVISRDQDGTQGLKEYILDADDKLPSAIGENWKALEDELGDDPIAYILAVPTNEFDAPDLGELRPGNPFHEIQDRLIVAQVYNDFHNPEAADDTDLALLSDEQLEYRDFGPKRIALIRAIGEVDGSVTEEDVEEFLTSKHEKHHPDDFKDIDDIVAAYKRHYSDAITQRMPKVTTQSRANKVGEKIKSGTARAAKALAHARQRASEVSSVSLDRYIAKFGNSHEKVETKIAKHAVALGAFVTALRAETPMEAVITDEQAKELLNKRKLTAEESQRLDDYVDWRVNNSLDI